MIPMKNSTLITIEPCACILGFMFGIEAARRREPADMQTG